MATVIQKDFAQRVGEKALKARGEFRHGGRSRKVLRRAAKRADAQRLRLVLRDEVERAIEDLHEEYEVDKAA